MRSYFPFAIIATALTVSSIANADTNVWTSLGPDGGRVREMVIDPQNSATLYAVSDAGVSKTIDGGKHWDQVNSGLPAVPVSGIVIDSKHPSTLYVGAAVGIFKSTDAAASWTRMNSGLPSYGVGNYFLVTALAISAQDPNTLYAGICCAALAVFKSTDGGATWMPMGAGVTGNVSLLITDPQYDGTVYAVTADVHSIFKSTDGGMSWTALNVKPLLSYYFATLTIDPQDSNTLYATEGQPLIGLRADGAPIRKSQDGGATWSSINTTIPTTSGVTNDWIDALAIDPQDARNLFAGTLTGVYKSTDDAITWSKIDTAPQGQIATLLLDPANRGVAYAGTNNGVFKTADGAASWLAASSGLRVPVTAVYPDPLNATTLYALSQYGISKSDDDGVNWTDASSGIPPYATVALAIDSQSNGIVYAAVSGAGQHTGGIFKSIDSGTSWKGTALPRGGGAEGMAIDPQFPATLYAWNSQGLYKTIDGSTTWTTVSPGNFGGARVLVVDPHDSNTIYGFASNAVAKSTDGGATFSPANSGLPAGWYPSTLAVDPQNSGILYASTNIYDPTGPKLFKTTDAGATWNPVNSGLQGNQISSVVIDGRNSNHIYAATAGFSASGLQITALFASTDAGVHWSLLSPELPTELIINGLALSPLDSTRLYAATSGGTFRLTMASPITGK